MYIARDILMRYINVQVTRYSALADKNHILHNFKKIFLLPNHNYHNHQGKPLLFRKNIFVYVVEIRCTQ